ncbi:MAG: GHKL domain-containing protein [Bifidobacterium pullorum]|uniref:sensor histidine kinase n=1 Tax=Bifidobacterium pullorum TaxID=78448 RepID=UPI0039952F69
MNDVMSMVGEIPDIPKAFTAVAEWLACVVYLTACTRRPPHAHQSAILSCGLILLLAVQYAIGIVPIWLWIPGMLVALGIMLSIIRLCRPTNWATCGYWLMRAFTLAEFVAAIEWQLFVFAARNDAVPSDGWFAALFLAVVYVVLFAAAFALEWRHDDAALTVTARELATPVIITVTSFTLSNLSYVATDTPFSSPLATEAFNIRTLVCLGGVAFLYAYHVQLSESHAKAELDAIRNVLNMQYAQYQQSKESIAIINHKYHDLKHQIAVLRAERDPAVREAHLDDIERGIKEYEARFKTGNSVLDTVLTGKSLICTQRDIELTCVADGRLLDGVSVMDVCTIFGNALDNAIEYEQTIEDAEQRLIHVTVSKLNGFAVIRVENWLKPEDRFANEPHSATLPTTTKQDKRYHGFGLKSIRHCAQQYGGEMTIAKRAGWFELTVLIPLHDTQRNHIRKPGNM